MATGRVLFQAGVGQDRLEALGADLADWTLRQVRLRLELRRLLRHIPHHHRFARRRAATKPESGGSACRFLGDAQAAQPGYVAAFVALLALASSR